MKYYVLMLVLSLTLVGCKSECDNCKPTKSSNDKYQQIESQDHYIPWWVINYGKK